MSKHWRPGRRGGAFRRIARTAPRGHDGEAAEKVKTLDGTHPRLIFFQRQLDDPACRAETADWDTPHA
ncbi:hypothetical protein FRC06_007835 [Ceratobasidium sp. 370]|nr:hypothetical protein FRC06_007835 [Ceratobasidium sp. 370]